MRTRRRLVRITLAALLASGSLPAAEPVAHHILPIAETCPVCVNG